MRPSPAPKVTGLASVPSDRGTTTGDPRRPEIDRGWDKLTPTNARFSITTIYGGLTRYSPRVDLTSYEAFWSYTHEDNDRQGGRVVALAGRNKGRVRSHDCRANYTFS